jgi:hypothetical protein
MNGAIPSHARSTLSPFLRRYPSFYTRRNVTCELAGAHARPIEAS